MIRRLLKTAFPRKYVLGRFMRHVYSFFWMLRYDRRRLIELRYNIAVEPLLNDLDLLNKKIKDLQVLSKSDSSQKKFFIINRKEDASAGLFSHVSVSFSHFLYAIAMGMIPIVDMQSYPNPYLEHDKIGKENAWEYYFKQPCGYGLDDAQVRSGYHVSGHPFYWQTVLPLYLHGVKEDFANCVNTWGIIYKHFFRLSDDAILYVDEQYRSIMKPDMRTIGVHCRGTDYTKKRPKNHAVQPEVKDVISKVKEVIVDWDCDYVYVMSDEKKSVEQFEDAFPGKVLSVPIMYYDEADADYSQQSIVSAKFDRENDTYLKGLEYLASVMLLSRCTSAVLSSCNGSTAALYINGGKYENLYFFDLGVY